MPPPTMRDEKLQPGQELIQDSMDSKDAKIGHLEVDQGVNKGPSNSGDQEIAVQSMDPRPRDPTLPPGRNLKRKRTKGLVWSN